jgi:hypothetical protein
MPCIITGASRECASALRPRLFMTTALMIAVPQKLTGCQPRVMIKPVSYVRKAVIARRR